MENENKKKLIENLHEEIRQNGQQMEAMKEATVENRKEQDRLQAAKTKVQFELAEQQRVAADLGKDLMAVQSQLEEERKLNSAMSAGKTDALLETERQLTAAREETQEKDAEVTDVKELLQEASEEFMAKDEDLENLEESLKIRKEEIFQQGIVIQDLQSKLGEVDMLLKEAHDSRKARESELEYVVVELENNVSDLSKLKESNAIRIIELETRNGGIEQDLVTKDDDDIKELENIMIEKDFKITEL